MLTIFDNFDLDSDIDDDDLVSISIPPDDIEDEQERLFADIAEKFVQLHGYEKSMRNKWYTELRKLRTQTEKDVYGISKVLEEIKHVTEYLPYTFPFGAELYGYARIKVTLVDGVTYSNPTPYINLISREHSLKNLIEDLVRYRQRVHQEFWRLLDENKLQITVHDVHRNHYSEKEILNYLKNDVRKARDRNTALEEKLDDLEEKAKKDFEAAEHFADKLDELKNKLIQSMRIGKNFLSSFPKDSILDVRNLSDAELTQLLKELFKKAITNKNLCSNTFETSLNVHDDYYDYDHEVNISLEIDSDCDVEVHPYYDEASETFNVNADFSVSATGGNEDLDCSSQNTYHSDLELVGQSNMTIYDLWHALCEDIYYTDWRHDIFDDIEY